MAGEGRPDSIISDETRKKMSLSKMGELNHFYGKSHSEKTRKILSEINKEKGMSGENNPFFGNKHTVETKKLLSEMRTGFKYPSTFDTSIFGRKGKAANNAKKFKLIDKNGNIYIIHGELKKFVEEHKLNIKLLRKNINSGPIKPPTDIRINALSFRINNTIGWEIIDEKGA